MMRVVVDTNVIVSAALKATSLARIALSWIDRHSGLLKSIVTEQEVLRVLQRPHLAAVTAPFFRDDLARMLAKAELVTIAERFAVCRDPNDDKFLELAVNGQADLIITGDADLLVLNPFRGIPIVSPATFVQGTTRR
jgi:putative PIN family toxin of toxin-antitoxin system